MIKVFHDSQKNRLIYVGRKASSAYWDDHWLRIQSGKKSIKPNHQLVKVYTPKFLTPPAKVLDAGCGLAESVATLDKLGFTGFGIDYAESAINLVKKASPGLNVLHGDIHALPFNDNSLKGIWSLGVIEHFWNGYDSILEETARVLEPGGFAFVTFPSLSILRLLKIRLRAYETFNGETEPKDFYQFILSPKQVISDFETKGFRKVYQRKLGGFKGLTDELPFMKGLLQKIYDSQLFPLRATRYALDRALAPLSNHTTLVVFQKI